MFTINVGQTRVFSKYYITRLPDNPHSYLVQTVLVFSRQR